MPISRQEFDAGRYDLSVPITDYLLVRREDAFRADEILEAMIQFGRAVTLAEVVQALESLVDRGEVQSKEIAGSRWYTISVP